MARFIVDLEFEKPEARKLMQDVGGDGKDSKFIANAIKPVEGYLKMIGIKIVGARYDDNN